MLIAELMLLPIGEVMAEDPAPESEELKGEELGKDATVDGAVETGDETIPCESELDGVDADKLDELGGDGCDAVSLNVDVGKSDPT